MSVGLLIITHNAIGKQLMHTATVMLGTCPLQSMIMEVKSDCDPDQTTEQAQRYVQELDTGDGVLVLTDMYGSTPSNIANRLLSRGQQVRVVAGINLPMLIRVLNYPRLSLELLEEKALSGGRDGVMVCKHEAQQ